MEVSAIDFEFSGQQTYYHNIGVDKSFKANLTPLPPSLPSVIRITREGGTAKDLSLYAVPQNWGGGAKFPRTKLLECALHFAHFETFDQIAFNRIVVRD